MKKYLTLVICFCLVILILPFNANASSLVEVANESELREALTKGDSVKLTADMQLTDTKSGNIKLDLSKDITIDGSNYTITTANIAKIFEIYAGDSAVNVTLKNITLTSSKSQGRLIDTRTGNINLTLDNVKLNATGTSSQPITVGGNYTGVNKIAINNSEIDTVGYAIITFNKVDLTIDKSKINGYSALYFREASSSAGSNGSVVQIINSELTTETNTDEPSNSFGLIIYQDNNIKVEVIDTLLKAVSKGETPQFITGASTVVDNTNSLIISGTSEMIADTKEEVAEFAFEAEDENLGIAIVSIKEGVTSNVDISDYVKTGYRMVEEDSKYVVYKEHSITLDSENVSVDKTKAIVGEEVSLTIEEKEGYYLKNIRLQSKNDETEYLDINTNQTFEMPDGDVLVIVEFEKYLDKDENIVTTKPSLEVDSSIESDLVEEIGEVKTDKTLIEAIDVEKIINASSDLVEVKIDAKLEEIKEEDGKVSLVFNIKPVYSLNGEDKGILSNDMLTGDKIKIKLPVPSSIEDTHAKVTHKDANGKVVSEDEYEVKVYGQEKYIEIETTSFSEFTVEFYTPEEDTDNDTTNKDETNKDDEKEEEKETDEETKNPQTLDSLSISIITLIISFTILSIVFVVLKNKKVFNK